jgi:cytochrome P450
MSTRRLSRLELGDREFLANPYPFFHEERRRGPVGWHEQSQTWLVVDHAACDQVLRERRLGRIWHDKEPAEVFEPFNLLHRNQMMENEPPDHSRLRRKVSTAFIPEATPSATASCR